MKTVLLPHSSDRVLPASAAIIKNVYPFQTENPSVAGGFFVSRHTPGAAPAPAANTHTNARLQHRAKYVP
jgi:hypothetical protein